MPVSGPVSVAIISSRSPFGPVMIMVRRSIIVGSALQDGALARKYSGLPINPQTVRRKNPGSIYATISSIISPVDPTNMVVTSVAESGPVELALIRNAVVLLLPLAPVVGAVTRFRNTIRPPGGNVNVVVVDSAASVASSTPTIDCPPGTGLSINTSAVQPCARLFRKFDGMVIVSVQLPTLVSTCEYVIDPPGATRPVLFGSSNTRQSAAIVPTTSLSLARTRGLEIDCAFFAMVKGPPVTAIGSSALTMMRYVAPPATGPVSATPLPFVSASSVTPSDL